MVIGKADIKGQLTNSGRLSGRVTTVKLDRTSINDDEVLAFNEPIERTEHFSQSPKNGNSDGTDQDYYGRISGRLQGEADEEQVDDEEDPFSLKD